MIVLAGRLREEEKYVGGDEFAVMKEERGFPVFEAAGECV